MPATIKMNGQEFELDEAIAADDQKLKDALAPYAPDIQNAQIVRSAAGEKMIVTITKRAGTKGSAPGPLTLLLAAPAWVNPALALAWQLKHAETIQPLRLVDWIARYPQIEAARAAGGAEAQAVNTALERLHQSRPIPAQPPLPGL